MTYKNWVEEWLTHYIKPSSKQRTYEQYCEIAKIHILPRYYDRCTNKLRKCIKNSKLAQFSLAYARKY